MTKGLPTAADTLITIGEEGRRITGRTEAEVQAMCRSALSENPKSLIVLAPRHAFLTRIDTAVWPSLGGEVFLTDAPTVITSALVLGAATALLSAACAKEETDELSLGLLDILPWAGDADKARAALVVVLMGDSQIRWHVMYPE